MGVQTCALRISGDSNYNAILASAVNSETFFVDKGTLTLTTTMKNGTTTVTDTSHVALGTVMKDEATLGGTQPFAPTGAVTFTFSDRKITRLNSTHTSFSSTSFYMHTLAAQVAAYSFGASFFFNDTATTEIYTLSLHDALPIYKGTLTLTTTMKNGTTTVTDTSHVALGTVMKDEATLGGTQPFAPTGAVTFTF